MKADAKLVLLNFLNGSVDLYPSQTPFEDKPILCVQHGIDITAMLIILSVLLFMLLQRFSIILTNIKNVVNEHYYFVFPSKISLGPLLFIGIFGWRVAQQLPIMAVGNLKGLD